MHHTCWAKGFLFVNDPKCLFWGSVNSYSLAYWTYCLVTVICVWYLSQKWHGEDELDVKAVMESWTLQEGFPLVTVEVKGREVRLSQERYLKSDKPSHTSE